jgi:lipopolysaccharide transport system permease protein
MPRHHTRLPAFFRSPAEHSELLVRLVGREAWSPFRGSVLGLAWALRPPMLTAAMFTFVFAGVFQSRWGGSGGPFDARAAHLDTMLRRAA